MGIISVYTKGKKLINKRRILFTLTHIEAVDKTDKYYHIPHFFVMKWLHSYAPRKVVTEGVLRLVCSKQISKYNTHEIPTSLL